MNDAKIVVLHWWGRFGNRMNTYAYCAEYARRFGIDFYAPSDWEGSVLFKNHKHRIIDDDRLRLDLNQTQQACDNRGFRLAAVCAYNQRTGDDLEFMDTSSPESYGGRNIGIDSVCYDNPWAWAGWSQRRLANDIFEFSDEVKNSNLYKRLEDRQGTYDIAHIRRDDITNIENNRTGANAYSVLSLQSYVKAFKKFGYDPREIEYSTDDQIEKWMRDVRRQNGGWIYPTGSVRVEEIFFDWFPDFLRLYFARTIFRANSSFSWWAACISRAKVYSPILHERRIYLDSSLELDVEFAEGNHPHWILIQNEGYSKGEIHIAE